MKIWLDDIRFPPSDDFEWIRSAETCITYLLMHKKTIEFISFDHDLGKENEIFDYSGYAVAKFIEENAWRRRQGDMDTLVPFKWEVHSANPAGRKRIAQAMHSAERFWKIAASKFPS
jgi:hypothetical protein